MPTVIEPNAKYNYWYQMYTDPKNFNQKFVNPYLIASRKFNAEKLNRNFNLIQECLLYKKLRIIQQYNRNIETLMNLTLNEFEANMYNQNDDPDLIYHPKNLKAVMTQIVNTLQTKLEVTDLNHIDYSNEFQKKANQIYGTPHFGRQLDVIEMQNIKFTMNQVSHDKLNVFDHPKTFDRNIIHNYTKILRELEHSNPINIRLMYDLIRTSQNLRIKIINNYCAHWIAKPELTFINELFESDLITKIQKQKLLKLITQKA